MTSRKTRVILATVLSAMLITETGTALVLKHELNAKTTEYKALEVEINTLTKQQKEYEKENKDLKDYVDTNKELIKNAQGIKAQNDEITKQNQELEKMNDMLKKYREATAPKIISRGGSPLAIEKKLSIKKITVELSAYGPTGGKTASGLWPEFGMVAAPDEISIGSGLIIDGYFDNRVFKVTDRGGYIQKVGDTYRIDVFMNVSNAQLNAFGRKHNVTAYLIQEE